MPPCGAALFAFRQFIGRAVDIGERQLCGTPVISRYLPQAVAPHRPLPGISASHLGRRLSAHRPPSSVYCGRVFA